MSEYKYSVEDYPEIIQGGMGIGVSNWRLAGEVAGEQEAAVVSLTAIGTVLARRLQDGDLNSVYALENFPDEDMAEKIIKSYFLVEGRQGKPYKTVPMFNEKLASMAIELNLVGSFAEVWLAKHLASQRSESPGPIGMNLLTKVELPTLSALYGGMVAGADFVTMGAGIPREIPRQIKSLAFGNIASIDLTVIDEKGHNNHQDKIVFNPESYPRLHDKTLKKPAFLAIVASNTLAQSLADRHHKYLNDKNGPIPPDGLIIEGPTAGGHNAPPRNKVDMTYGTRDEVDLEKIKQLKLPFWLAGGYGTPEGLQQAKQYGAKGIQVGSAFALTEESGIVTLYKQQLIDQALKPEGITVITSMTASSTNYPFKVAELNDTLSNKNEYKKRERVCDLGYLRQAVRSQDSQGREKIVYRCAAEPVDDYVQKGGNADETNKRVCLCNGLLATVGLAQIHHKKQEKPILTLGDNVTEITRRIVEFTGSKSFSAKDVIHFLKSKQ